jgi:hypothetical protein
MVGSAGPLAMDGAGLVAQVADRLLATFNRKTTDLVEFSRRAIRRLSWSSTRSTAVGYLVGAGVLSSRDLSLLSLTSPQGT